MAKKKLLPKVTSLGDLMGKARTDERYRRLLIIASQNLAGPSGDDIIAAYRHLEDHVMETDEDGVVAEVNFCRDLV